MSVQMTKSILQRFQDFVTGDPQSPTFDSRSSFLTGIMFAVAGVGVAGVIKVLSNFFEIDD